MKKMLMSYTLSLNDIKRMSIILHNTVYHKVIYRANKKEKYNTI